MLYVRLFIFVIGNLLSLSKSSISSVQLRKGSAKVATRKEGEQHIVCVHTEDFTDLEEVNAWRAEYRRSLENWAQSHLGISAKNEWKLRHQVF